jgi:hypothetical protein
MTRIGVGLLVALLLMAGGAASAQSCTMDSECDDGVFCTGIKHCELSTGTCVAVDRCPAAIQGCLIFGSCDEARRQCPGVPTDSLCPQGLVCAADGTCVVPALAPVMDHSTLLVLGLTLGGVGIVWSSRRCKRA